MRIVAGVFRSRVIDAVPGNDTRPTADKIKEAIFNRLGQYFSGGKMLDLFAGSGNMGLEALSRGMDHVVFVDKSKFAIQTIQTNIKKLQVNDQCRILAMDYEQALHLLHDEGQVFDLIYLDPPYLHQQIASILLFLATHNMVNLHGLVVCESLKEDVFEENYASLHKVKDTTMGITRVTIYERTQL